MDIPLQLAPEKLQPALSSVRVASVTFHDSLSMLPPAAKPAVMSVLAASASTLTALHGIPLRGDQGFGLTAFTQLRALTLQQWRDPPDVLRATDLPPTVRDLTLDSGLTVHEDLPRFAALDELHNLRRITLRGYRKWQLGSWDEEEGRCRPLQLPLNLAVRAVILWQCFTMMVALLSRSP